MEDSPLVTDALRLLLEETGHRVRAAASIGEAVAACRAERPDLVLLDLTLPDGDGLALLDELTAHDIARPVTVAMTGHDDPETRERCLKAGCVEVLVKPVPARELVRRVGQWVAKAGSGV